jgi:multiple sugar transport system substrate-binding protein
MKRIFSVLIAVLMVFSLGACSSKTNGTSSLSGKLSGTITYSTWGSLDEKKVNVDIITAFEKDYPGCKVNLDYIPDNFSQKIDTEFLGGNAPDVIYGVPTILTEWAAKGLLMNLDARFKKDSAFFYNDSVFTTSEYDRFKWGGHQIATVNGSDTWLLYYNKDLFDKAGVSYPNDNWTWDDFVSAGKKLTILDGAKKQYGIILSDSTTKFLSFYASFGGSIFDSMDNPKRVTMNNDNNIAALKFVQDCIHTYKIAPTTQDTQGLGGSFDTGKVAMDIDGAYDIVSRKNITDFKWDVANLPVRPGYPRKTIALYAGYAVNNSTKNADLSWEFAKYFQSDTAQKILASYGLITVINKQISSSDDVVKAKGMPANDILRVSSLAFAENAYQYVSNANEIDSKILMPLYDQLIAGTKTPAAVAKEGQTGLESMLSQAIKQQ